MFGIEAPIFAFSHCRDVVAAVSRTGGTDVLRVAWMEPGHLEQELACIDDQVQGRPYGVDMVFPSNLTSMKGSKSPREILPDLQRNYINGLMDTDGVPSLPEEELTG